MGSILIGLLSNPKVRELLKLLITALLGGLAGAEVRQPVYTAAMFPGFFGQRGQSPDPVQAIGRISFARSGCTATVIGPIGRSDSHLTILTAAHCVNLGQTGTMKLKDGRTFTVRCVSRDAESDCAWLTTARPKEPVPFALLASSPPTSKSVEVWHQGYGIDNPGNKEVGKFQGQSGRGQLWYRLSVSPGDSGGGIVTTQDGQVLSPVCCTTRLAGTGDVFGADPRRSAAIRPSATAAEVSEEPPVELPAIHPIVTLPAPGWPEPHID